MKYDKFGVEKDVFRHREHIYFLVGFEKGTNCSRVVASYSLKTKFLIVKDTSIIGYNNVLVDFINIVKEKERNQNNGWKRIKRVYE